MGAAVPRRGGLPSGITGGAFADTMAVAGRDGLIVLNDAPVNAATPAHPPDDNVVSRACRLIRSNGLRPDDMDAGAGAE